MNNQCIIIGGGNSINEGIALGLKEKLQDRFVIALNYAYKHFPHTCLCFMDKNFYKTINSTQNPDIYEELKAEALIIGKEEADLLPHKLPNTIFLKGASEYAKEKAKTKGFYSGSLTGIFALTVASYLLNYRGTIFLLGYDWNKRNPVSMDKHKYDGHSTVKTHYYRDIVHRGMGWLSFYENHAPETYFKTFLEPNLKIYNVNPTSNIECFEKIKYEDMFIKMNNETCNQEELRHFIRIKLQ